MNRKRSSDCLTPSHKKRKVSNNIGFKKCGVYIVKLQILGRHNETRDYVVDKDHAKFRCSKALVLDILKFNGKSSKKHTVFSDKDAYFKYTRGEVVEEKGFDKNLNEVCSSGIHYFKTFETAKFYNRLPKNYTGLYKEWWENGQLYKECTYKSGKLNGPYKEWWENGQLKEEGTYKNGEREDGPYKRWYENGK